MEGLKELVAQEGTDVNEKVGTAAGLACCMLSTQLALTLATFGSGAMLVTLARVYVWCAAWLAAARNSSLNPAVLAG